MRGREHLLPPFLKAGFVSVPAHGKVGGVLDSLLQGRVGAYLLPALGSQARELLSRPGSGLNLG